MSNEEKHDRPYKVYRIDNGTAIDHIPSPLALKVVEILGIAGEGIVTVGMNFPSKRLGRKDVVKIENHILARRETDLVSLVAPTATINIIEDGRVKEKRAIHLPDDISGLLRCPNPNCVTNDQEGVESRFHLVGSDGNGQTADIRLRCHFCERVFLNKPEMIP